MAALEIFASVISDTWGFFTHLMVPGMNIPFSAWFLAGLLIEFVIISIQYTFGFGSAGYRAGQSGKKRNISNERKRDEK